MVSRAHEHLVPAAILSLTSSWIKLHDVMVEPRYLNVDTASTCDPPKSTSPTIFGILETSIILVFVLFTFMQVCSALFLNCTYVSSMVGRCSPQTSTPSAYPSLSILVLSSWMDNLVGGIFHIIHFNTKLNKSVDRACDGLSVQAVCKDLALSQEDDSPTAADQVGKVSDSYNLTITREIPERLKSAFGYEAKNTYLDSFQTRSGSSPKLLALVRIIQVKERPTSKYQPPYVFKHKKPISVRRLSSRPTRFKLAYARNIKDKDREGFGMKSGKKAKDCYRKTNYAFWNPYMFIIMCISLP